MGEGGRDCGVQEQNDEVQRNGERLVRAHGTWAHGRMTANDAELTYMEDFFEKSLPWPPPPPANVFHGAGEEAVSA